MTTTRSLFRSGHLSGEGIGLYVDGLKLGRTGALPKELLDHVAECGQCRTEVVELHQLLNEVPYAQGSPHPFFDREPMESRSRSRIPYAFAAMISVAVGVTYLVFRVATQEEGGVPEQRSGTTTLTQPETAHTSRQPQVEEHPTRPQHDRKLLAADFEPSPNLEDLVGSNVRSSSVEIVSPSPGDTLSGPIRFVWKADEGEVARIIILSNRERVVESAEVGGSAYALEATLSPGLYYWKLEGNDDLLAVGRFIVR